jgi:hypothetical protein
MIQFDENGKRLRSVVTYHTHYTHDVVEEDLSSRFDGLSDNSVKIVRDMVSSDKIDELNKLLVTLNGILK